MPETERMIPVARHEPTDVGPGFIWGALVVLLGVLIGLAALVLWMYPQSALDRTLHLPLPTYPAPRLQPSPPADLRAFRRQELEWLNGSGWIDRAHTGAHIPIETAMRDVAQEGIPGWPAPPVPPAPPVSSAPRASAAPAAARGAP